MLKWERSFLAKAKICTFLMTLVLTEHCSFLLRLTGYLVENIFFSVRFRSFFNVLKWSRGKSKYNKCLRWSFRPGASSRPKHAGLVHVFEIKFFSSFLDEQDLEFYVHPNHVNSLLQGFFVTGVLLPELSVGFFPLIHPAQAAAAAAAAGMNFLVPMAWVRN